MQEGVRNTVHTLGLYIDQASLKDDLMHIQAFEPALAQAGVRAHFA
mgnify:CR=1 FL=1